uniref:Uncharacterized protein n=1 Tax=Arundo donax TaxID=35708 RepID=A0A0A9GQ66_ARUDO
MEPTHEAMTSHAHVPHYTSLIVKNIEYVYIAHKLHYTSLTDGHSVSKTPNHNRQNHEPFKLYKQERQQFIS